MQPNALKYPDTRTISQEQIDKDREEVDKYMKRNKITILPTMGCWAGMWVEVQHRTLAAGLTNGDIVLRSK